MRLLLLGCTGLVGRELVPMLRAAGHNCTIVSRYSSTAALRLDPSKPIAWTDGALPRALDSTDGVINLAGEPIADQRWSPAHLQRLHDSRLLTTRCLVEAMGRCSKPPLVLINASAVGFYGTDPVRRFTENSPAGDDMLANLCCEWEKAAQGKPEETRLLVLRIGVVLAPDGGALGKMLPVFRAGFGGPIGDGRQWVSWIHRTDLCRMITNALMDPTWVGVINGVAPNPASMTDLAASLGRALGRPSLLSLPGPILRVLLGEGAKVVLEGQCVVSDRLESLGFIFSHPDLPGALAAATSSINR